jgi:hypothetical protein
MASRKNNDFELIEILGRDDTNVFAAVSPHDGTLDALVLPEVNTLAMSLFRAVVAQRHPTKPSLWCKMALAGTSLPT